MSNESNWSLLLLHRRGFLIGSRLFFVLCFLFGIVSFVTTNFKEIKFQSQVRLSQIKILVPICLTFKLYAVLIE